MNNIHTIFFEWNTILFDLYIVANEISPVEEVMTTAAEDIKKNTLQEQMKTLQQQTKT